MRLILGREKDPYLDLALDEAALVLANRGESPSSFRAGEVRYEAVVLGTGSRAQEELSPGADGCVLRRTSGGCAVVLAPGMLAYSGIFLLDEFPEVATVRGGYELVCGRVAAALRRFGIEAQMRGKSDVACGGLKLSGNSQARKRNAVLVHGTLLVEEPPAMAGMLEHPPEEPDYRAGRGHGDFLACVRRFCPQLGSQRTLEALARAFPGEAGRISAEEMELARKLALKKYSNPEWTNKGRARIGR